LLKETTGAQGDMFKMKKGKWWNNDSLKLQQFMPKTVVLMTWLVRNVSVQ